MPPCRWFGMSGKADVLPWGEVNEEWLGRRDKRLLLEKGDTEKG